jgi:dynein heavy chain 2
MHQNFELNLSQNPALTTKSIIWMNSWGRNTMQNISMVKLQETFKKSEANAEEMIQICMQIHQGCEQLGATPLKFMTFIENYNKILTTQRETQGGQSKHLIAGLAKLREAEDTVDKLSTAAT